MLRSWLTGGTVFLSGALLLTLELFVARALLPMVGGSALAWTTCVAFFQVVLLSGSLYAHLTARFGIRRQICIHAALVLASLAMLPLKVTATSPPLHAGTVLHMIRILATSIGLPCFLLCTTTSLVLQWVSVSQGERADRTYAASNAGSLSGLIAYPFLIEPQLGLSVQARVWTIGFAILAAALSVLMTTVIRTGTELPATPSLCKPARWTPLKWFVLAFVPCSLLLGVTSHMTNELPSFPLLWVVPLALYLLSLVLAFATRIERWMPVCQAVEPVLISTLVILMFVPVKTSGFLLHLAAVFVASLIIHGRLARTDPEADRGAFVLWTCAGGAFAGIFHAAVAPLIFPFVVEFQLAIVAACFLREPIPVRRPQRWATARDIAMPALLAGVLLSVLMQVPRTGEARDIVARTAILFVGAGVAVIFRRRPLRYGLGMAAVLLGGFWTFQWECTEMVARSAYGVSRVVHDTANRQMMLFHGTTIHGAQGDRGGNPCTPRYYFRPDGPLGKLLTTETARQEGRFFAVVGLGAGSLAWYVQPSQRMRFYEIDPVVETIARQSRWFSYLSEAKGDVDVVLGDGRLSLAAERDGLFDAIILDAFSSDSAPTHLLTGEAFDIYLRKLKPHGILVVNTSNRHIDLAAVVVAAARSRGLQARITLPPSSSTPDRKAAAEFGTWAVMARSADDLTGWLRGDDRWVLPQTYPVTAWTDDRAGILPVLRW
jgi:predicted membrane-bound spermidine synthase